MKYMSLALVAVDAHVYNPWTAGASQFVRNDGASAVGYCASTNTFHFFGMSMRSLHAHSFDCIQPS